MIFNVDPDWNPASDKQAAGRIWREGQKKRCFIYRFMSTSTVEEKIIQRQLSKESLQSIVDDKEAVNLIPQNELKSLFIRRKDTRSDTHDTLRCKRCNSVRVLSLPSDSRKLTPTQAEECREFLQDFTAYVKLVTQSFDVQDLSIGDLNSLCEEISKDLSNTLPSFSKQLRKLVSCIQEELDTANVAVNISEEFLNRWADFVPMLSATATSPTTTGGSNDQFVTDDASEFVPQEGCPEEEDFNRWSHHCSVLSCDDEALRRAVGDSDVVSFLFGLEVNWSLLQERQESKREEEELRKEQQRIELEALNKRRASRASGEELNCIDDLDRDEEKDVAQTEPVNLGKRKLEKNSETNMNSPSVGGNTDVKKVKRRKNVIVDDENEHDDDVFIIKNDKSTLCDSVEKPVLDNNTSTLLKKDKFGTPESVTVSSSSKESVKSKRKFDAAADESRNWLTAVLAQHELFPDADLCDAFEALLMCIINVNIGYPSDWSSQALHELIEIATDVRTQFEQFPWNKAEKRVLLRPIFQNGTFSVAKLQSFKPNGDKSLRLGDCLKTVYERFCCADLPRSVSSILKSCKYTHKSLTVMTSAKNSRPLVSTRLGDGKENVHTEIQNIVNIVSEKSTLSSSTSPASASVSVTRSKEASKTKSPLSSSRAGGAASTLPWLCPRCTFESTALSIRCDMCG